MSMLNGNFTKTKIVYESMHDFYTFLNAVTPET